MAIIAGYGIWTGASATNSQITINGNTNFSDSASATEAYAIRHDHGSTVINGDTNMKYGRRRWFWITCYQWYG